jgi:hypothetical protein
MRTNIQYVQFFLKNLVVYNDIMLFFSKPLRLASFFYIKKYEVQIVFNV